MPHEHPPICVYIHKRLCHRDGHTCINGETSGYSDSIRSHSANKYIRPDEI